jgi:hypothetical protein
MKFEILGKATFRVNFDIEADFRQKKKLKI